MESKPEQGANEPSKANASPTPATNSKQSASPSSQPKVSKTGTKEPVLAVVLSAVVFVGLAVVAYYAYTKSN